MGATGTYRTYKATKFLSQVIANELICSSEALNRILEKPGTGVQIISDWVSSIVAPLTEDRSMTNDCENISEKILLGNLSNLFR
tara:strand:+ start:1141 stop:1392 length:252 start_codon:yes stop_codon:yes gene_type:complete